MYRYLRLPGSFTVPLLPLGFTRVIPLLTPAMIMIGSAQADLRPEKVYVAESRKTQTYIKDGLIVGGDQAIQDVVVKDIRRAKNPLFERVVIDLEGSQNGEPAAIKRPPYYQAAVTPDEHRLVFTLWGTPKLAFDAKKVAAHFKQGSNVQGIELLPKIEKDSWTFALHTRPGESVEVFELTDPARIIVDIRGDTRTAYHASAKAKAVKPNAIDLENSDNAQPSNEKTNAKEE